MLKFCTEEYVDEKIEYFWEECVEYWARSVRVSRFPLSGDVTQWITAWGEVVGQMGLLNFNLAGSSNPRTEKRIGEKYSYGRQLGRILDVLGPLVELQRVQLQDKVRSDKLADFEHMIDDIERMKHLGARTYREIVRAVQCWKSRMQAEEFEQAYEKLMGELEGLKPEHAAPAQSPGPENSQPSAAGSGAGAGPQSGRAAPPLTDAPLPSSSPANGRGNGGTALPGNQLPAADAPAG